MLSSTDVSNIIQSQVGMFSASANYAQSVSAMYGYQSMGGMGVHDPRTPQPAQAIGTQGGYQMGTLAARAPGYAMGTLGLAAAFGAAPRYFDPFTTAMHVGGRARSFAGLGAGIGMGGLAFGAYSGLGAIGNFATQNMVAGAQARGLLNQQFGSMFPHLGLQGASSMSSMVENMSAGGMGSISQLSGLIGMGAQSGQIDTTSLSRFQQTFTRLARNARQVANTLNTSITEAKQAMDSVATLGVRDVDAAGFLAGMRSLGKAARLTPSQMMGVAQGGAQFARSVGIDTVEGSQGAMVTAGVYSMAQGRVRGIDAAASGRYSSAAFRFLGSRQGRQVLGAMMTAGGELDMGMASAIASGTMTREDIQRLYRERAGSEAGRNMLTSRSSELAGQFVTQFGPQAISGALQQMTGDGSRSEILRRTLTGLTRTDLQAMDRLATATPALRDRLMAEARAGLQEGMSQNVTIGSAVNAAIEQIAKPYREKFRRIGAGLTQSASNAVRDIQYEFTGRPSARAGFDLFDDQVRAGVMGDTARLGAIQETGDMLRGMDVSSMPSATTRFARRNLPTALRLGAMGPGTSFSDLPMYGLAADEYSPERTALSFGMVNAFRGRNAVFGLGAATSAAGRGLVGLSRLGGSAGLGGRGLVAGTAAAAGYSMRGLGALTRGIGRVGGVFGMGLAAVDVATNIIPGIQRRLGMREISGGALSQEQTDLIEMLMSSGQLDRASLGIQTRRIGDLTGGLTTAGAEAAGLVPMPGMQGEGRQRFISRAGLRRAEARIGEIMALPGVQGRIGASEFNRIEQALRHGEGLYNVAERRRAMQRSALEAAGLAPEEVEAALQEEARKLDVGGRLESLGMSPLSKADPSGEEVRQHIARYMTEGRGYDDSRRRGGWLQSAASRLQRGGGLRFGGDVGSLGKRYISAEEGITSLMEGSEAGALSAFMTRLDRELPGSRTAERTGLRKDRVRRFLTEQMGLSAKDPNLSMMTGILEANLYGADPEILGRALAGQSGFVGTPEDLLSSARQRTSVVQVPEYAERNRAEMERAKRVRMITSEERSTGATDYALRRAAAAGVSSQTELAEIGGLFETALSTGGGAGIGDARRRLADYAMGLTPMRQRQLASTLAGSGTLIGGEMSRTVTNLTRLSAQARKFGGNAARMANVLTGETFSDLTATDRRFLEGRGGQLSEEMLTRFLNSARTMNQQIWGRPSTETEDEKLAQMNIRLVQAANKAAKGDRSALESALKELSTYGSATHALAGTGGGGQTTSSDTALSRDITVLVDKVDKLTGAINNLVPDWAKR